MNGVHDLGGMDNMGPISIEANEPVFHDDWERYIFCLTIAMISSGYFQIDEVRRETELIPPVDYLAASYYEKWLFTLENLMVEKNVMTWEEIKAGKSLREEGHKLLPAPKELVEMIMTTSNSARKELDTSPKFAIGESIIAKNINPFHHTRIPRYVRGKRGVIEDNSGAFLLPDKNAYGDSDHPEYSYTVKFSATELWGEDSPKNDFLYVDLFESYMELEK